MMANPFDKAVTHHIDSDANGVGKADRIGAAMAFDQNALKPQQHRAIVVAGIKP
jgi:hypothetical protein